MARLEELTTGSLVKGLVNNESVQIVAVRWYGTGVLELTYKNSQGMLASQLVYREDEARLSGFASLFKYSKRSRIAPGCLTSGSQFGHTAPPAPAAVLSAEMHLKKNCCKTVRQGL